MKEFFLSTRLSNLMSPISAVRHSAHDVLDDHRQHLVLALAAPGALAVPGACVHWQRLMSWSALAAPSACVRPYLQVRASERGPAARRTSRAWCRAPAKPGAWTLEPARGCPDVSGSADFGVRTFCFHICVAVCLSAVLQSGRNIYKPIPQLDGRRACGHAG